MSERMNKERAREEIEILYAFLYDGLSEKQKQALDIAIECLTLFDDYQEHINKLEEHEEELLDKLEKIDSLDNEWVDVRDRLPEDRERVLVSDDTNFENHYQCASLD